MASNELRVAQGFVGIVDLTDLLLGGLSELA